LVIPPFEWGAPISAGDAALHYVVHSLAEYDIPLLFLNILSLLSRRILLCPLPQQAVKFRLAPDCIYATPKTRHKTKRNILNTRASTKLSPLSAVLYGRVPNPSVALFFRVAGLFREAGGFGTRRYAPPPQKNAR
jgi:hypothetical protein